MSDISQLPSRRSWAVAGGSDGYLASVRPSGPLRVNNGDAMMPALVAGTGLGVLPDLGDYLIEKLARAVR